ncbi:XAC2610-related protein [uncultured Draconibacterium sp.]|uniref:XAC2610-related protein n=1 Tax=uncultured Draconibacterium sp. TaxID=1573823 RepID=UPI003216B9F4
MILRQILIIAIVLISLMDSVKAQTDNNLVINCDSIFKTKGYQINLTRFDFQSVNESNFNSIFIFSRLIDNKTVDIFKDSIFTRVQEIKFEDYNNDHIKDILIQNYSDVRSNWTYYLYLVDKTNNTLIKVKGFEEIKNPKFNPEYNIVENYVISGKNWTSFYKIDSDKIIDFDITIFDGEDEDGNYTYDEDYKNAINLIKDK